MSALTEKVREYRAKGLAPLRRDADELCGEAERLEELLSWCRQALRPVAFLDYTTQGGQSRYTQLSASHIVRARDLVQP